MVASGEKGENPAIHLWDIHTLKTIHVFQGDHKADVHLMEFVKADSLLITASLRSTTPIVVYDVASRAVVFSYCVSELVRYILPIQTLWENNVWDKEAALAAAEAGAKIPEREPPWTQNFVLLTQNQIIYLKHSDLHSVIKQQNIKRISGFHDITCGASYCRLEDLKQPGQAQEKSDAYDDEEEGPLLFVYTGHRDGKVVLWEQLDLVRELPRQAEACPVVEICLLGQSVLIANQQGVIDVWSLGLELHLKRVDTKSFNSKLMSNNIKNIVRISANRFYFNTYGGDFLKMKLETSADKRQASLRPLTTQNVAMQARLNDGPADDGPQNKAQLSKGTKNIAMLESLEWVAMTVVQKNEERLVFVAGISRPETRESLLSSRRGSEAPSEPRSLVYGFSLDTHEMVDLASYKELVTAMDGSVMEEVMSPLFVYGLTNPERSQTQIAIRKNWSNTLIYHSAADLRGEVTDIKFSPGNAHVVCCTRGAVFCFKVDLKSELSPISLVSKYIGQFVPVCFNFCDREQTIIVTSEDHKHWKTSITQLNKLEELGEGFSFNMSLANLAYVNKGSRYPVVMGQGLDFVASMRGQCLEFWKSLKDLKSNCGVKAFGHASDISKICISHTSPKDAVYTIGRFDNTIIEWKLTFDLAPSRDRLDASKGLPEDPQVASSAAEDLDLQLIERELNFCKKQGEKKMNQEEKTSDHLDSMALFRGSTFKDVNSLNHREEKRFEESNLRFKRVPEISISLNHVYGIECFSRRKTVHFLHYYSIKDKHKAGGAAPKQPSIEVKDLKLPANYLKEMLFSKYSPIPYDQKHQNCDRYIAYFVSRVAIVTKCTTGSSSPQRFYEGHKARISCMATHPSSSPR